MEEDRRSANPKLRVWAYGIRNSFVTVLTFIGLQVGVVLGAGVLPAAFAFPVVAAWSAGTSRRSRVICGE
jgi:ABC-type dipeptide/oligopeptide/nickel transport system permease component